MVVNYIKEVLENIPNSWLNLTTHRLDIYDEKLAKTQFLYELKVLYENNNSKTSALNELPTAYDYIRLGHPLSCLLEWGVGNLHNLKTENVICFSSKTTPVLSILRKNSLDNKKTQIIYKGELPIFLDIYILQNIYGYNFDLIQVKEISDIPKFNGTTVFISQQDKINTNNLIPNIDFFVNTYHDLGSILLVNGEQNESYISSIQHVRRRETIAMTPANCFTYLKSLTSQSSLDNNNKNIEVNKKLVLNSIKAITETGSKPLVASSGLSIQYAIMMGIVHDAVENHKGKNIKIIVPPNCYGGTNDQARRVAACIDNVEVVDLAVDGNNDMVKSIDVILDKVAREDGISLIIAEIPTNPRVEVPDLIELKNVLSKERKTLAGQISTDSIFILDQTFCPNIHFLGEGEILSSIRAISYTSGSKFPSGGLCTAGYCVGNNKTESLMKKIEIHLRLCDNEATSLQMEILAKQLPSMNQRIIDAYKNTREFVNFINDTLPKAKINFVTEELAKMDFTPSVFSLDLPTKGLTSEEKEFNKRASNLKLINLMITEIPNESKFCVSYGQLKGCYWTVPATSTQGTTKEGDKDYIVRVALSPNMDIELHKKVFLKFIEKI
jgi:cystathionine beta-lyase/cystathionine gamma-synthase